MSSGRTGNRGGLGKIASDDLASTSAGALLEQQFPAEIDLFGKKMIQEGSGDVRPHEGCSVEVHLVGKFKNRIFDERDIDFVIGEISDDEVIAGVQTALQKFGKGETSRLVIKPEYAFGVNGHKEWNIPTNATVEYTVTLKNFKEEVKASELSEEERIEQAKIYNMKGKTFFKDKNHGLAVKMFVKSNVFIVECDYVRSTELLDILHSNSSNLCTILNLRDDIQIPIEPLCTLKGVSMFDRVCPKHSNKILAAIIRRKKPLCIVILCSTFLLGFFPTLFIVLILRKYSV